MDAGERRDLEAEQRHLDETYAAYDTAVRLLRSRARTSGVDDFATEALERMRLERVRARSWRRSDRGAVHRRFAR